MQSSKPRSDSYERATNNLSVYGHEAFYTVSPTAPSNNLVWFLWCLAALFAVSAFNGEFNAVSLVIAGVIALTAYRKGLAREQQTISISSVALQTGAGMVILRDDLAELALQDPGTSGPLIVWGSPGAVAATSIGLAAMDNYSQSRNGAVLARRRGSPDWITLATGLSVRTAKSLLNDIRSDLDASE